jgi:tRNA(Arg) A34 adenosine deaminase TadA
MQPLLTSLLGEAVELVRDCFDSPAGTRGVVRAVYLSGNPDREEVGKPLLFPYCLVQVESGELLSFEAIFLRVVSPQPPEVTATPFPELDHATFMRRAIAQAQQVPLLPFGAVLVRGASGEILAEGHNRSARSPTFHGEIDVINRLAADQPEVAWGSLVLYTTAEPCPMCQSAIEWAGIPWVVYGSSIPFLRGLGWRQIDIRAGEVAQRTPFRRTAILGGVLAKECNALFEAVPRGPG